MTISLAYYVEVRTSYGWECVAGFMTYSGAVDYINSRLCSDVSYRLLDSDGNTIKVFSRQPNPIGLD